MQTIQILYIQLQRKELILLLFLMLNLLGIVKCLFGLYHIQKVFDIAEAFLNQKKVNYHSKEVFYSPMLSAYLLKLEKEQINYEVDISKNISKKIEVMLNTVEKENTLFILTLLFQTAFPLIKKSDNKQFLFQISCQSSHILFQITYSIPSNSPFYVKKTYGKKRNFCSIQKILKKQDHFDVYTEIIENFVYHKIQISRKSPKTNQKSFSSHKH